MRIEGDARGMVVCCTEGVVWLTQPGDSEDHFIAPGETFAISRKGVVMVEAWRQACITLAEPETAHRYLTGFLQKTPTPLGG